MRMEEYRCYAGTIPRRHCTHVHTRGKDKLRPLLLTLPFVEGSNPGQFATLSTTQPLSHMWLYMRQYERKYMKLWIIGQRTTYISRLHWNGTTRNTMWILLCQHMSWINSQNTVTLPPWNHSIARIHPIPSNMVKTTNRPLPLTKVLT